MDIAQAQYNNYKFKHLYVIPLIVGVLLLITPVITFTISVLMNHVTPIFPMVSETGNLPPESFVFSVFFNICGFLSIAGMIIHYSVINKRLEAKFSNVSSVDKKCRFVKFHYFENIVGVISGALAAVGLILVANLEMIHTNWGHLLGAGLVFTASAMYVWAITILTWLAPPSHVPHLPVYRAAISVIVSIAALGLVATVLMVGIPKEAAFTNEIAFMRNGQLIRPGEEGFDTILVLGFCEWLVVIMVAIFILTLVPEMKQIHMTMPEFIFPEERHCLMRENSTRLSMLSADDD